jgi:hypothetical protein
MVLSAGNSPIRVTLSSENGLHLFLRGQLYLSNRRDHRGFTARPVLPVQPVWSTALAPGLDQTWKALRRFTRVEPSTIRSSYETLPVKKPSYLSPSKPKSLGDLLGDDPH